MMLIGRALTLEALKAGGFKSPIWVKAADAEGSVGKVSLAPFGHKK